MQKTAILTLTSVAAAAILAHRFVDFDGTQADAAGSKPMGVSVNKAEIGEAFPVDVLGTTKVEAGAAIPLGAKGLTPVMAAADGRAVAFDGVAGSVVAGYARQAAAGAGAIIEVLLTP